MPGPARFLVVLALLLARPAAAADTVPPASAEVTVTLVQIEVRVEDKKGNFVSGLGVADLEVLEDGAPQKAEYVDEIAPPAAPAAPAATRTPVAAPAPAPPAEARPPGPAPSTLLLVVDRANSSNESIRRQRQYLDRLLASLEGRGTVVSVIEIKPDGGYQMLSNLTADLDSARRAIERIAGGGAGGSDRRSKTEEMESILEQKLGQCAAPGAAGNDTCQELAFRGLIHAAFLFAQEERARGVVALQSLRGILGFADHLPGSRSLLLVSEGLDPGGVSYLNTAAQLLRFYSQNTRVGDVSRYISELQREVGLFAGETPRIQDLTRLAQRASVTVHWVNPSSGDGKAMSAEQQLGSYTAGAIEIAEAAEPARLMQGLAEDTGGLALPRAAGLDAFFARLGRDLNTYYVVSYTPNRRYRDGTPHEVAVKVRRPGARVRLRRSYVDLLPEERRQRALAAALDFPDMFATFPLPASLSYLWKDAAYHVRVRVGVPYAEIAALPRDGRMQDTLLFGWAVRDGRGELVKSGTPSLAVDETGDGFSRLVASQSRLDHGFGVDLGPGKYTLVTAVLDATDLKTATRRFELELPAPRGACLAATPLMLALRTTAEPERVEELTFDKDGTARWRDLRFTFAALLAFPASGKLSGVYQLLNPSAAPDGQPDVQIFFRLYRGTSFVNQTPPTRLTAFTDTGSRSIAGVFAVPYSRLQPGDYRLELVARDARSGCDATGAAAFLIVASDTGAAAAAPATADPRRP